MPPQRRLTLDAEAERAKRALRAEITAGRCQLERRLASLEHRRSELADWRTYVRSYPLAALALAASGGWLLAVGLASTAWPTALGRQAMSVGLSILGRRVWSDLSAALHTSAGA